MFIPRVCIIILQYNHAETTIRCLDSLAKINYPDYQVIVIDNGSQTEEASRLEAYLQKQRPDYRYIKSQENTGYSGGNNLGLHTAMEQGSDYVMILNNDTVVPSDLLEKLVRLGESDRQIGIVGPAIDEGNDHIAYGGTIQWLKPELSHNYATDRKPDFLTGACWLIKADLIKKIGYLDESYFLYFEDADYCLRARKAGYRLALSRITNISHEVSVSAHSHGSAKILRYHYRNSHLFNAKHGPSWVKVALPIWSFYIIVKQLLKIIFIPAKRQISRAILLGVVDFYMGRFGRID